MTIDPPDVIKIIAAEMFEFIENEGIPISEGEARFRKSLLNGIRANINEIPFNRLPLHIKDMEEDSPRALCLRLRLKHGI